MELIISGNRCIECRKCEKDCPADAVNIDNLTVDSSSCIECGHCAAICPKQAISVDGVVPGVVESDGGVDSLLKGLRSVRSYNKKEVEESVISEIVDTLKYAPSASNSRPLELEIYTKSEEISQLNEVVADALQALFSKMSSPIVSPILSLLKGKAFANKMKSYRDKISYKRKENKDLVTYKAPVVIILHGPKGANMIEADSNIWLTYMTIAAKSRGLSTCINGFIVTAMQRDRSIQQQFGIDKSREVCGALLLGYSNVNYSNDILRDAPVSRVHK